MSSGLTASEALRVVSGLHAEGVRVWVAGGWGVDALAGRQTRPHRDLDLALDVTGTPVERAIEILQDLDYVVETDWLPSRVELAAPSERWVDLHPLVFDDQGAGWQANLGDLPPFRYPPDAFTRGSISGAEIGCLSIEQQLLFHTGYPPRPHDLADVRLLQQLLRTS